MNKDILNYNLIRICEQLSTEQILNARKNRNWSKFDKMNDLSKLMFRLEELQIYEDIIDPDYIPDLWKYFHNNIFNKLFHIIDINCINSIFRRVTII